MSVNKLNLQIGSNAPEDEVEKDPTEEIIEQAGDQFMSLFEEVEKPKFAKPVTIKAQPKKTLVLSEEIFELAEDFIGSINEPINEPQPVIAKTETSYMDGLVQGLSQYTKLTNPEGKPEPKSDVDLRIEGLEKQFNMWKTTLTEGLGGMGGRNLVSGIGQGGDGQTPGGGAVWLWDLDDVDIVTNPPVNGAVLIYSASEDKWVPGAVTGDGGGVQTTRDLTLVNAATYQGATTFSDIGIDPSTLKVQEDLNLAFAAKFSDHNDEIAALQAGGGGNTYILNADAAPDGSPQITLTDQDDSFTNVKFVATGGASLSVANDIITIDTSAVSGGTTFLGGIDAAVDPSTLQGSPVGGHYFVYKASGTAWEGTAVNRGDWAAYSAEDTAWEVLNYTGGGNGNGTITSVGVSGDVLALEGTATDPVINLDPSDIISLTTAQHYTKAEIDARVLDDLADVSAASPVNGSHLIYSTTNNRWETGVDPASVSVGDNPPSGPQQGDMWFDSAELQLHVYYTDADSSQWVVATNPVTPDLTALLNKSGDTMTGPLILSGDPTVDLGAATKQQVDAIQADVDQNESDISDLQTSAHLAFPFNWKLRTADNQVPAGYFHYSAAMIKMHQTSNDGTQFSFITGGDTSPRSYTIYARNNTGWLMRRSGTVHNITYHADNTLTMNITEKLVGTTINNNEAYYITISGLF